MKKRLAKKVLKNKDNYQKHQVENAETRMRKDEKITKKNA